MNNASRAMKTFTVDEVVYTIQFSLNGMAALEQACGTPALRFIQKFEGVKPEDISFGDVRLIFWAGLQEHHPDLTLVDAGRIAQGVGGALGALNLAVESLNAAMPKQDKKDVGGDLSHDVEKKMKGTA